MKLGGIAMKQLRLPFIIVLVLAVGLFAGMVLEMHVLSRIGSPTETGEQRPTTEGANDSAVSEPVAFPGGGGFGSDFGFVGGPPEYVPPQDVWIEARFIEIATADLDTIQIGEGEAAVAADEKLLLTADERTSLLAELKSKPTYRLLGRASGTIISGNQVVIEGSENIAGLNEDESSPGEDRGSNAQEKVSSEVEFRDFAPFFQPEKLGVGIRLNAVPTVMSEGNIITLVVISEVREIAGWLDLEGPAGQQPVIRGWDAGLTVYCPAGMTFLMPCNPVRTPYPHTESGGEPEQEMTVLLLVTARLIELPGKSPEPVADEGSAPDRAVVNESDEDASEF
jgi:hypothetical protein